MYKLVIKAQRKNGTDRDLIIQILILIETTQEHEFVSFRSKDIYAFVAVHSNSINVDKPDVLKTIMDKFIEAFDSVKIPIISVTMVLFSGYRIVKNKKSFSKLVDLVKEF